MRKADLTLLVAVSFFVGGVVVGCKHDTIIPSPIPRSAAPAIWPASFRMLWTFLSAHPGGGVMGLKSSAFPALWTPESMSMFMFFVFARQPPPPNPPFLYRRYDSVLPRRSGRRRTLLFLSSDGAATHVALPEVCDLVHRMGLVPVWVSDDGGDGPFSSTPTRLMLVHCLEGFDSLLRCGLLTGNRFVGREEYWCSWWLFRGAFPAAVMLLHPIDGVDILPVLENLFYEDCSNRDPLPVQGGTLVIRWAGVLIAIRHVSTNTPRLLPYDAVSSFVSVFVSGPLVVVRQFYYCWCITFFS